MTRKKAETTHWKIQRDSVAPIVNRRLTSLTKNQTAYMAAIDSKKAVVCIGPAGTGKTYVACGKAIELMRSGEISKIVLSRPMQECDEELGFIPGDQNEKIADMMVPLLEALDELLEPGELERMQMDGRVVMVPLGKMRGRTLKDSFVILDEAQNATFRQLKMFLTRFGTKARMVVCGDCTQSDLPRGGFNSLDELVTRFLSELHPMVAVVSLTEDDIVRDELVAWFHRVMSKPMGSLRNRS